MSDPRFPDGWDAERAQRLIDHYENLSEDELIAEDDAATDPPPGQAIITVPEALLPAIRQLLAAHEASS